MHTYIHTYIHIFIHTYIYSYIHTFLHIYIHILIYANRFLRPTFGNYRDLVIYIALKGMPMYSYIRAHTRICMSSYIHILIHTCIHICMSSYIHICIHTCAHVGLGAGFICEIQINHNEFQNYSLKHDSYAYYLFFRLYFNNCYEIENSQRLQSRLKCIKKMDQIGTNYDELDRFIQDFLHSGGRVTRDLERSSIYIYTYTRT